MGSFLEDLPSFAGPLEETWSDKARAAAALARKRLSATGGVHADDLEQERRDTEFALARGIGGLKHGESYSVPLPEGSINVTRATHSGATGALDRRRGYHVEGGGQAVNDFNRRGPRNILGRSNTEREVLERQRSAHEAEQHHTADNAARAEAAHVGSKTRVTAITGHSATVTKQHDGTYKVDHETEDLPSSTHSSAAVAVHSLKKVLRDKKAARFLPEGHDTDPLSTMGSSHVLRNGVVVGLHRDVAYASERTDRANPVGAIGDVAPDVAAAAAGRTALTGVQPVDAGVATSAVPQGSAGELVHHIGHMLHHLGAAIAGHPAAHHAAAVVPHAVHPMMQSIEYAEGTLQEALSEGDLDRARRARRRLFEARLMLREQLDEIERSRR